MISSVVEMEDKDTHNYQGDTNDPDQTLPVILKKESDQLGMLEYNKDQEDKLLRAIITELKPRIAAQMLPGEKNTVSFIKETKTTIPVSIINYTRTGPHTELRS